MNWEEGILRWARVVTHYKVRIRSFGGSMLVIFLGVFMSVIETPHVTGCLKIKNQYRYKYSKLIYLLRALFIALKTKLHLTNPSPGTDSLHSSGL
jgi:hypothetical protein